MPSIAPDKPCRTDNAIHVAVGVVANAEGEILIARRPDHLHQGGLWEFPGGKVEAGEHALTALQRELAEEIGITLHQAEPLIQVPWCYTDKIVLLDVFCITAYAGETRGREGQTIKWVARHELATYAFPEANRPILTAMQLPGRYLITGDFRTHDEFITHLQVGLAQGIQLVQLRARTLTDDEFRSLVNLATPLCKKYQAQLLVNSSIELAYELNTGVHLNSQRLMACRERPVMNDHWLAASVHNETELQHAMTIGVDFVVMSPVLPTPSHPGAVTLGWQGLQKLLRQAPMPVYALGGLTEQDLARARQCGAQGIAAISAFWQTT